MKKQILITCAILGIIANVGTSAEINTTKLPDDVRAQQIKDMKWGMFICWSFSTFYGHEWTPTLDKDASYFKATGCDTDQWCKVAKEAGMAYILFLAKHHDGFCLWDTKTTDKKVTNSPLGIDVLAKLRKSCDKYGLNLALYFSQGDWNWPEAVDGKTQMGGNNPEMKKAQLKELLTQYGPVEFWWMDAAAGKGGLSHEETVEWVHNFQPNSFVGFNSGTKPGRLNAREHGGPGPVRADILVAEFTYPILPRHKGGADWFYSLPKHDNLCHPAEKLYEHYLGAVKYGNIFSINVGPGYAGKLRDIDVKTLREVGEMIKNPPPPPPTDYLTVAEATASSSWSTGYEAAQAIDNDPSTRWGAAKESLSGWLQIDLGQGKEIGKAMVMEASYPRTEEFVIEYKDGENWKELVRGTTINGKRTYKFNPVTTRYVRLNILKANEVPTIEEFQVYSPEK